MTATTTTRSIFKQFYTHKRTQALLEAKGIKVKSIEKVSITKPSGESYNSVHVIYIVSSGSRCSTFISCKEYLNQAMQNRRVKAMDYKAQQGIANPQQWKVTSNELGSIPRRVTTTPHSVTCDCEDFNTQANYLSQHPYLWNNIIKGHRICKHAFATLNELGFGSLRDYLAAWKPEGWHVLHQPHYGTICLTTSSGCKSATLPLFLRRTSSSNW